MRSFWNGSGIIPGDVPTWLAWSLPTFPDQTNPGFHVRFFQSFDSLVLTAAHLFHNIFDREEDIYSSLIVDPVILYGQGDPVQHECIQDLRIRRKLLKCFQGEQLLGDTVKGMLVNIIGLKIFESDLFHHNYPLPIFDSSVNTAPALRARTQVAAAVFDTPHNEQEVVLSSTGLRIMGRVVEAQSAKQPV